MPRKFQTEYPGVRYYEHATRTYGKGISKQPDKYFSIRLRVDGKLKEEGCGWQTEGWSGEKAFGELLKLKQSRTTGKGPRTLADRRKLEKEKREVESERLKKEAEERQTFFDVFIERYLPNAQLNKSEGTVRREQSLFKCWLSPAIGEIPLRDVTQIHLEQIKKSMRDAGQSARSISYALALVRQIYNYARRCRIFVGDSPTVGISFPKEDNRRMRFLTHQEAAILLERLKKENRQLYEISLISLHAGLRAGEILPLKWGDVLFDKGLITVKDTKNKVNRVAYMTRELSRVLSKRKRREKPKLLFTDNHGEILKNYSISRQFRSVVETLKFNDGVTDDLNRVVFHTLRHTFCSWLVEQGVDLYTVNNLAGHKTISVTARYSHLGNEILQTAMRKFEEGIEGAKASEIRKTLEPQKLRRLNLKRREA